MFSRFEPLKPDAILGISKLFAEDSRTRKIDLGVGVFRNADGRTPVLNAVKAAEQRVIDRQSTKSYTPPEGVPGFPEAVARLILGANHDAIRDGRCAQIQTVGGCGALRLGAELLRRADARAIYVGEPTWPNHYPLFTSAGHEIRMIPYYDPKRQRVNFDAFLAEAEKLGPKDTLLLHGVCHNPTGADLDHKQIDAVIETAERRGFLPFVDIAYHGFGGDLDADAYIVREMARRLPEVMISYSCSKNFGLYRERTGALIVVSENSAGADAVRSHLVNAARGNYSMPPAHGGAIVAEILQSTELRKLWVDELNSMRDAVKENRRRLVRTARETQMGDSLDFIEHQNGMFSLLPLSEAQVDEIRLKHGVYMAGSGRINLCGVNAGNVEHLCETLRDVIGAA